MTWLDKKLYWLWVEHRRPNSQGGFDEGMPPTPTEKRLDYVTINKGSVNLHPELPNVCDTGETRLVIGVWDDDRYTPLHRDELERHLKTFVFDDVPINLRPLHGQLIKRSA